MRPLTPDDFARQLPELARSRVCAGLSGGADSVVLLHLLAGLRDRLGFSLSAVHVHHGLSADADGWLAFCREYCARLDVPFAAERVHVDAVGLGVEAAARQARYAVFARQDCDVLALAHHQDDQVETFWLAALRGGGIRALSAMPAERVWQGKRIIRPLLAFSRAQVEAYAAAHNLAFVEDASNRDPALLRNWLRHTLLPEIAFRLPESRAHILAAVAALQEERALLDETTAADWAHIHQNGRFSRCLWRELSPLRRRQMLLQFAKAHALGTPAKRSLADFARVLDQARQAAEWKLPQGRAVLYRETLFPVPDTLPARFAWVQNPFSGSLKAIAEAAGLSWRNTSGNHTPPFSGCLRAARKSDFIAIRNGRKNVFRLLQEHGVAPFARGWWAVAVDETGACLAVANIRSDAKLRGALLHSPELAAFQAA